MKIMGQLVIFWKVVLYNVEVGGNSWFYSTPFITSEIMALPTMKSSLETFSPNMDVCTIPTDTYNGMLIGAYVNRKAFWGLFI